MATKKGTKKGSSRKAGKKGTTKASGKRTSTSSGGRSRGSSRSGFRTFAMHSNDPNDAPTFDALRAARPGFRGFGMAASDEVSKLDPETVARQYLQQSLASDAVPSFTAPQTGDASSSDFKSLGTETLPLTNTKTVKFRQTFNQIPIYSSLVTVELDENNEFLAINSALGTPSGISPAAKVAPADALKKALKLAGSKSSENLTPRLNYYFDRNGDRWRLVYIIEDVPIERPDKAGSLPNRVPFLMDYVIDAHTGALVAELPRTATMAGSNEENAVDGMGKKRSIRFSVQQGNKTLHDDQLNVLTYDFKYADPSVNAHKLPGSAVTNPPHPWERAAVSAHANASAVARFLREVLKRNNIDNQGGPLVSTVNCVVVKYSPGKKQWFNAFWTPTKRQMVYGQVLHGTQLRSLAVNLDVVGHEMFHGVTNDTSRLEYAAQSGALNESYSDIFGIIISNYDKPDIGKWNWELGEGLTANEKPLRDLSKPSRYDQPEHMKKYRNLPVNADGDWGGVHINSGIHNFAAYKIMTARDAQKHYIFKPSELAAIFYISLTQHLTRNSDFSASRRGVTLAAQTLFRNEPPQVQKARMAAITKAFTDVGIPEPGS